MKNTYYLSTSIASKAQQFLDELMPLRIKHSSQLVPKKAALLVLDMQHFFVEACSHAFVPSSKAIIPQILALQNYFLEQCLTVIHTRHCNTKFNAYQMQKWWPRPLLTIEDPASAIIPELCVNNKFLAKLTTITKSQYDAFWETDLDQKLKATNIEQIVITGVMTHLCCESTARSAFIHGYEVFIVIDGTATYNENFHRASLLNLAHGFAKPLLTSEILATC
jgi:isochorismate hydrolase